MSSSTGFLHDVVAILNRDEPDDNSSFGLDANGITWHLDCCVHANVGYSKGKAGMNVGALDVPLLNSKVPQFHPTPLLT